MKSKFNDKYAINMADFRFSLIAPVIQGTFTDPTKTAYYRRVTENSFTLPNGKAMVYNPKTLEKWEEYYRKKGMDGLMPRERSDSGQPRVLDETAINEIQRLKEIFHRINATLIYTKLIEDGFINQYQVSLSSIQRFIKHNNLKSAVNPNQKDRKAFEEEYPCGMYHFRFKFTASVTRNMDSNVSKVSLHCFGITSIPVIFRGLFSTLTVFSLHEIIHFPCHHIFKGYLNHLLNKAIFFSYILHWK